MARRISILGATGSIGKSTADLIRRNRDRFDVVALTANKSAAELAALAREFDAELAVVADPSAYDALREGLAGSGIEAAAGPDALSAAGGVSADLIVAGIVGAAGLDSTLSAVGQGTLVALANKESLVCAGDLVLAATERSGTRLLPLDSEHNAIFQVFETENAGDVEKLILTASGGPFRTWSRERMAAATPDEAIAHPNWDMGRKISVDSATMMNKGLELIEAAYLFPVGVDDIDVLVHPQSVVHSMVAYVDGSVLAQMGTPDMRVPIAHALAWPARMESPAARLDLAAIGSLEFEEPDHERFPSIALARSALSAGRGATVVLNAANEVAVESFLDGRIGFLEIAETVMRVLDKVDGHEIASLEDFRSLDRESRHVSENLVKSAS
ncbi:MAG: 1-deoxy-D-xylulose-5-phosphate reductoisomerase [Rhodospirillaceae bacterium]|nr:1-deoxy-D-xylulose-5-phosphate reductoisomerase [Rhodospirillaceae bacterium]MBT5945909.1 1-deoxy-D-xylulose-5-phosphate reductoisomerase [Rhodospirillaceae bacterium]MBT6403187.1 1-deoxy-D-xylulose-5-phosphate reductoisomerase [Rhodospirillaceae bacterium]MBT6534766.1 1-deoxy-D-xylulose-5-phosphate reductoisomerase [Rhodospirillaceae bacterium]MBT7361463.1 1-deoxy-D-xylulose-5-phosphate reductoisomerase [Rhodospirillaceae bacterium]